MTSDKGCFITFQKHGGEVTIANSKALPVQGGGTIDVPIQGKMTQITGVIYVPELGYNLLSIGQLADRGIRCNFTGTHAELWRDRKLVATARRQGKAYVLGAQAGEQPRAEKAMIISHDRDAQSRLWHRRLGYPGEQKLQ